MSQATTRLLWAVHCHQPVGNFDFVFEHAYQHAYLPFLQALERHPGVGVDFHFTGILLDWLDAQHPDYLDRVKALVTSGRCGLLAGAYYEPILPPIPEHDQVGQIVALVNRLEARFGVRPRGMWLAERVWEPQLPKALSQAGIEFTLLDGTHFKQVGFGEADMFGRWLTESEGSVISVFPIHDGVRDLIPFADVETAVQALRDLATVGGRDVVFGDDGEKFGDWPGTFQLCYEQAWLDRFFAAVESDPALSIRPVSEAFETSVPQGMAYLPAASYFEMMEWAERADRQKALRIARDRLRHDGSWDAIQPFVRGVSWRNFLVRYPESNRMHKMATRLSLAIREALQNKPTAKRKKELLTAQDHVWQAQCNCGYWHGVFGGLYLPHLRRAIHGHLARAQRLLRGEANFVEQTDWDLDGTAEVILGNAEQNLSIHPGQGGIIPVWYLDRAGLNLTDSMTRQPEAYHGRITGEEAKGDGGKLADQFEGNDAELAKILRYDNTPRASGLVWWFSDVASVESWQTGSPAQHWVGGNWDVVSARTLKSGPVADFKTQRGALEFRKSVRLLPEGGAEIRLVVENKGDSPVRGVLGLEWLVNLLAGNAHDRWLQPLGGEKHTLGSQGQAGVSQVGLADEWLDLKMQLTSDSGSQLAWQGVHTVNQSVSGYETVYQGTAMLSWKQIELPSGEKLELRQKLVIEQSATPAPL